MNHIDNFKNYAPESLRERFRQRGIAAYRADQVGHWLYRRGVEDPRQMTDLGVELRERLAREWSARALELAELRRSSDGTKKAVLRTGDGELIEAVFIPEEKRGTLCVSTQVGCPLACSFCATGAMGFRRNLRTAEIVDQLCRMREVLDDTESITNLVFMGMGEPLLNLPALLEALRLLVHPKGFGMAPRRVTVSTAGVVPKIEPLLEAVPVNLAVSLHATTDEVRNRLVPLNERYPLDVLLGALRASTRIGPRRPVFFEYTLIRDVNDSLADARRIPQLLRGIPAKLNVIPMNSHPASAFRPPTAERVDRFTKELHQAGVRVTLRRDRGADIQAACGQLAGRDPQTDPPAGLFRAEKAGLDAEPGVFKAGRPSAEGLE